MNYEDLSGNNLKLVAWEATRCCSLKCLHCRANANSEIFSDELSTNEAKKIFESIRKINKCIIIISGGEPLLRKDLEDLIYYASKLEHTVVLAISDGSLLTKEKINNLKLSGVARISFSLHYNNEKEFDKFCGKEGSYKSILTAIDILQNADVDIQINTTVMKTNYNKLDEIYYFVKNLNPKAWHLFFVVSTGRARYNDQLELTSNEVEQALCKIAKIQISEEIMHIQQQKEKLNIKVTCAPQYVRVLTENISKSSFNHLKELHNQLTLKHKNKACMAGDGFVFISNIGDVKPCGYFDLRAGNIRQQEFHEIYTTSKLLNELRSLDNLKGACSKCYYKNLCGGCRAKALAKYSDYLMADPDCILAKKAELV